MKEFFQIKSSKFTYLPGKQFAYWVSDHLLNDFINGEKLGKCAFPRQGLATGDNDTFLRLWYEPNYERVGFGYSSIEEFQRSKHLYAPYNKGGEYSKWYGNRDLVIKFDKENYSVLQNQGNHLPSKKFYFSECTTWSALTTSSFSCRYCEKGFVFDTKGSSCFCDNKTNLTTYMGFLNSIVADEILKILSPTVDYNAGTVANLPILIRNSESVNKIVEENVIFVSNDYDSFETSRAFHTHPLISVIKKDRSYFNDKGNIKLLDCFKLFEKKCKEQFNALKSNEEELNRIFIDIYELWDELTPEVDDKEVTVHKADLQRDIKSLLSYAIGCMFGRYSLDTEGLVYAGGEWDASKYQKFPVDEDNIIPICDDEYFEDDLVGRLIEFVKVVYGEESLEENLQFIADALGGKGSSREVIRNYFRNDFFKDHCKIYQKRPIYWLFDSGKKGGFKALIYMHRYQPDTIARMRTDYVHEQQARYRTAIEGYEQRAATASGAERVMLNKKLKTLREQSEELHGYEEKIHHLADQMISIDLDDGVKHNYAIFQDVLAKIK